MKKIYVDSNKKQGSGINNIILAGVCVFAVIVTLFIVLISNKYQKETDVPETSSDAGDLMVVDDVYDVKEPLEVKKSEPEMQEVEKTIDTVEETDFFTAPCYGDILNGYSPTVPVYSDTLGDWRVHNGIDIAAPLNSEVYAVSDGMVESYYEDLRWGTTIIINHNNNLKSIYSNLSERAYVQVGQKIKKGDVIARVGDTALFETVADTHLHFEMKINDVTVNPLDYFNIE